MSSSMTSVKNWAKLSLIAAAVSMAVGCSDNDSDPLAQLKADADAAAKVAADAAKVAADANAAVAAAAAKTPVSVFDGAAIGCAVQTQNPSATASEVTATPGVYNFATTIPNLTVATATGCTDTDTGMKLATMKGVVLNQALIVSPISSLVVEAALTSGATIVTQDALNTASTGVKTALGLPAAFNPVDPETGNYAKSVVAGGTVTAEAAQASQAVQKAAFTVATMMKAVEKSSANPAAAAAAVTEISKTIAAKTGAVNLTSPTQIQAVMPPALAAVAANVATVVTTVAAAPTVQAAGAIVQAKAATLNDTTTQNLTAVIAVNTTNLAPIVLKNAVDAVAEKAKAEAAAKAAADKAAADKAAADKAAAEAAARANATGSATP